jgi:hypothetical protein
MLVAGSKVLYEQFYFMWIAHGVADNGVVDKLTTRLDLPTRAGSMLGSASSTSNNVVDRTWGL